jgi:DNA-binding CsgD family transcriptional regulator
MTTLVERDAAALLSFVSDLHEVDDPLPFPPQLVGRLHALVRSDAITYSELDPVRRRTVMLVGAGADGRREIDASEERVASAESDLWWELRCSHPVCARRLADANWTSAYKVSDFATLAEFRRTPIYDAFYRGVLDRWLDVGLAASPRRTRLFIFARKGSDFDERDRLVLELLQPHLEARSETAERASAAAAALAGVEDGATDEARSVVLCSDRGVIEFASPSSRALLERYLSVTHGRLPAGVLGRTELVVARDDRQLTIRTARVGALHVLLLGERDLRLERLTPREREILERVARGRANDEIAAELGIATSTVAKHLEHVYTKVGARNRTAAAALIDVDQA